MVSLRRTGNRASGCRRYGIPVYALIGLLMGGTAVADESLEPDALFRDDARLDITLTAPLATMVKQRPKDDYLDGKLSMINAEGREVSIGVEIRTRGHYRHNTCDFPPLMLNFKKKQTEGTLLDQQNKLKLVVHCDDPERYEQAVLTEYLAYRMLNVITDASFRVRLLRITYIDSEQHRDGQVRYAFLIEHKNRLAERIGLTRLDIKRTSVKALRGDLLNLTSVYQYFIGNTDFSPLTGPPGDECCHNYVLFGDGSNPITAVPYDFDHAGLVDAPYARPSEQLRIRSVKKRLYRGRCSNNEYLEASLQRFRDRRDALYALIENQEGLTPRVRERIKKYVDDFYGVVNDPRAVERKMIRQCV